MSRRSNRSTKDTRRGWESLVRLRPRVWAALLLLAALSVGGHLLWQRQASTVARHPQYALTVESVEITPPPPWIRSDLKTEVLRDAGLIGNLSVLEDWDVLLRRIRQAFEFNPWVASVRSIERRPPNSLAIELEYRQPIAAVESGGPGGVSYLPIDVRATRLPDADLTDVERRYLPRISGVTGRPLVGDVWDDPRVVGGAKLAIALSDVWHRLRLVEILPSPQPLVRGDARYFSFEIVTSGGTRIVWGATPGEEPLAGESPLATKRKRLLDYAANNDRLDRIDGPAAIDVRGELVVTPRTAKRKSTEVR